MTAPLLRFERAGVRFASVDVLDGFVGSGGVGREAVFHAAILRIEGRPAEPGA